MEDVKSLETWAYVELMGHNKISGFVTELKLGNSSMIRIDVPQVEDTPKFTKIFNVSAVYGLTPVDEQTAKDLAKRIKVKPLDYFDMQQIFAMKVEEMIQKGQLQKPQLTEAESEDEYLM